MALVPGPRVGYSFTNPVLNPHDPSESSKKSIRRAELEPLPPEASRGRIREPVGYPVHAALPAAPALTSISCVIGVRVALPQVLGADGDVFDLRRPITSVHAHGDCKADGVETPRGPGVCREATWRDNRPAHSHLRLHSEQNADTNPILWEDTAWKGSGRLCFGLSDSSCLVWAGIFCRYLPVLRDNGAWPRPSLAGEEGETVLPPTSPSLPSCHGRCGSVNE